LTEIPPLNGWSWQAISSTDTATSVAKIPIATADSDDIPVHKVRHLQISDILIRAAATSVFLGKDDPGLWYKQWKVMWLIRAFALRKGPTII
jgi:hypothetical protein